MGLCVVGEGARRGTGGAGFQEAGMPLGPPDPAWPGQGEATSSYPGAFSRHWVAIQGPSPSSVCGRCPGHAGTLRPACGVTVGGEGSDRNLGAFRGLLQVGGQQSPLSSLVSPAL